MRKRSSGIKINAVYVLFAFLMVSTLFLCLGQRVSAEGRGSFTLQVGKTRRLQSQGGSAPYTWSTGNSGVATVTEDSENAVYGIVTGVGEGSTTITLHSWKVAVYWYGSVLEDFTETWTVTVTASGTTSASGSTGTGSSSGTSGSSTNSSPTRISLNKTSVKMKAGSTVRLSYTLTPSTASSTVSFSSSNSSVASVSSSGKITAKKAGTATITAKTANGKTSSCKVTVTANPSSIKLSKSKLTLKIGKTKTLNYTLSPSGSKSKVTYKSSNSKVASVSSGGKVTAKKAGTATITAKTANGKKAVCKVTVKAPGAKKITLETSSMTMFKGEKQTLSYTLSPANAVGEVAFKSSKTSVITVSAKGVVKAKKAGTATLTATLANGRKATCKVIVYTEPSSISLSKTVLLLATGDTSSLSYELSKTTDYTTVTWKSSDASVASVDSDGKITAKENGTAMVTATTANGKSASCAVTVDGPHITALTIKEDRQYLQKGGTYQLSHEASPSTFVDTLSWSSSNPSVVTVDSTGKITGVQAGTATITVYARFSEAQISGNTITTTEHSFSDSCEVTVTEGLSIDMSNGSVTITADTVTQNGTVYEYDDTYGVTLVQSGGQTENIIKVQSYTKPVHVILAGVNLKSNSIALDVGAYYYNVTVELKTGTDNYLESYGSSTIASPMRCAGGNAILTGGGNLTLVSHSASALLVATGLNISGGTITAVTYDTEAGVIGTKNGRCSDITISGSSKVYAYGGYEAVGAGRSGTNESDTISVAAGAVTYSSTIPASF